MLRTEEDTTGLITADKYSHLCSILSSSLFIFEQLIQEHTFLAQLVRAGDRKVTDPGLICGLTSRYILMTPVVATTLAATTAAAYIGLGKDERI